MEERIATLRRILDGSAYTVALCGSGMMEEGGFFAIKAETVYTRSSRNMDIPQKRFLPAVFIRRGPCSFLNFTGKKY